MGFNKLAQRASPHQVGVRNRFVNRQGSCRGKDSVELVDAALLIGNFTQNTRNEDHIEMGIGERKCVASVSGRVADVLKAPPLKFKFSVANISG